MRSVTNYTKLTNYAGRRVVEADVICGGGRDSGKLSRLRYTPRLPKPCQWLSLPSPSHDHHLTGLSSIAMRLAAYTGVSDVSEREWQLSRTPADLGRRPWPWPPVCS